MRIITAPDSFKGSLTSIEASQAMATGIRRIFPQAEIIEMPVADGGEGTLAALVRAGGGQLLSQQVHGPRGETITAHWGLLDNKKTAVIEMAEASGLLLVPPLLRDPRLTSTFGTGQLIRAALDHQVEHIIVAIGGSATNDGGAGMAAALGVRFLDMQGKLLPPGGAALIKLADIDINQLDSRLKKTKITIASDVKNPLCGPNGASLVYGPQKGASPASALLLDQALAHYAMKAQAILGLDVANQEGSGAAGGLGAGLMLFLAARFKSGIDLVLDTLHFDAQLVNTTLVFTGEGCTDEQTLQGKVPAGIAARANRQNIPVICISGSLGKRHQKIFTAGIAGAASIVPRPMTLGQCMRNAYTLLTDETERVCRLLQVGSSLPK